MIKLLAIKYPTSLDIKLNRDTSPLLVTMDSVVEVKDRISDLIIKEKYDYILIKLDGKLFICEMANPAKLVYSHRQIHYHPYEDHLATE